MITNNPIDAALDAAEDFQEINVPRDMGVEIEIDIRNSVTGAVYPKVIVLKENTMRQILKEYAADISIDPNASKIVFTNKRTKAQTFDLNETVRGLGLENGDILLVNDDGVVG